MTCLFNKSATKGVYPRIFKKAESFILPNPVKRGRILLKSYRSISLLSYPGKSLQRLQARRMLQLALNYKILAKDQCGAIGKRSASDLKTALLCDMKDSLSQGKFAGIITVDVIGAFDGVPRNRLLHGMKKQGQPANLIKQINSFLLDRSANIRLDGPISDTFQILNGLPQDSPDSPILFLLYMEPVLGL